MTSFEKTAAETPIDAELVSAIQADIESADVYRSLSEQLRTNVGGKLRDAIEHKIKEFNKHGDASVDIRSAVSSELKSLIEQESIQARIINEKSAEIKESIIGSKTFIDLGEFDQKLQEKVFKNIDKFIAQEVRSITRKNFSEGRDADIDSIVSDTTTSLMRKLEKDVRQEKLLRKLLGLIKNKIEHDDAYINLPSELKNAVTLHLNTIVEREFWQASKEDVTEEQLVDTVVKKVVTELTFFKGTATDRIVGNMTERERQTELLNRNKIFGKQEQLFPPGVEREKTEKEVELLNRANELTNEILEKMGLEPFDIPLENVHVIKAAEWDKDNKRFSGFYHSNRENVTMRESPQLSVFFSVAVHELLHMKSHQAIQKTTGEKPRVRTYRLGMIAVSRDGKDKYFTRLNEGITEELTKRICEVEIKKNPVLQEEYERTESLRKKEYWTMRHMLKGWLFNKDTYNAHHVSKNKIRVHNYTYRNERKSLNILIEKISKKNGMDREEVFKAFAKSMMTGHFVELARMVEDTFGKGTFREIGKKKDAKELLKFVESL